MRVFVIASLTAKWHQWRKEQKIAKVWRDAFATRAMADALLDMPLPSWVITGLKLLKENGDHDLAHTIDESAERRVLHFRRAREFLAEGDVWAKGKEDTDELTRANDVLASYQKAVAQAECRNGVSAELQRLVPRPPVQLRVA